MIPRQIKIALITDTPHPIIECFNELWNQLIIIEMDVLHTNGGEFVYYIDGDERKLIFYQDMKMMNFWCVYELYWLKLFLGFYLNYKEKQEITKILLENVLNVVIPTPELQSNKINSRIERILNKHLSK